MRFASPQWLWALAFVPLIIIFIRFDLNRKKRRFETFAAEKFWSTIVPELDWSIRYRKSVVFVLAISFFFLTMARPQWGKTEETVKVSGLDIVFLLDVSNSMMVEDMVPSRLKKAKHLIASITEQIEGDRAGIIAFAESNYLAVPITTDLGYLRETLDILDPRSVTTQGTNLGSALITAVKALDRAAEDPTRTAATGQVTKVIIALSDGEDHENEMDEILPRIKEQGIRLLGVGVGTERGGPIPVRDDSGQLRGYKRDSSGKVVLSQFHPKELMSIVEKSGGKYWNATQSEDEVGEILKDLSSLSRGEFAEKKIVTFKERFQIPLAIGLILLFFELSLPSRRKIALSGIILFSFFGFSNAMAYPGGDYIENQNGIEALGKDQPELAKKHFENAIKQNPKSSELKFNQGFVDIKKGNVDEAIQSFDESANAARGVGDAKTEAQSLFNKGVLATQKNDAELAAQSYLDAIDAAKRAGDEKTLFDAKKNLELLDAKEQEKKKQQQKDNEKNDKKDEKNKKESESEESKDKNEPKDGSNNESKSDKSDQNKDKEKQKNEEKEREQNESRRKPQEFQSNKISKDSANRVMAELSAKEKELQAKLKKQKGLPQAVEKDW